MQIIRGREINERRRFKRISSSKLVIMVVIIVQVSILAVSAFAASSSSVAVAFTIVPNNKSIILYPPLRPSKIVENSRLSANTQLEDELLTTRKILSTKVLQDISLTQSLSSSPSENTKSNPSRNPPNISCRRSILTAAYATMLFVAAEPALAADNTSNIGIGKDPAFKQLPKRAENAARQRLMDITELQDERLSKCIDRGEYWEQCFFSGMRDDSKGIDYQWGSPEAALEPPSPSFQGLTTDNKLQRQRPPTW